jgi:prepilin-type N-terminal cleavage/methylation domain-containing protein
MPELRSKKRRSGKGSVQGTAQGKRRGEAGFTLVEMSMAMLIMGILMIMITSGIGHLTDTTLQAQALRNTSSQLDIAYLDLDSEVRYANQVWAPYPGAPSTDDTWDIEFESTFSGATVGTCTELQYNYSSGQLLQAVWTSGATTAPGFKMLANELSGSSDPFTIIPPNPANQEVQLMVTLTASSASGAHTTSTSSSVTFTALNSTSNEATATTDTDCTATWTTA